MAEKEISGTITSVERTKHSKNGNPRFIIGIDDERYTTKPDTGDAYKITTGDEGKHVTVGLDGLHRIVRYDAERR